MEDAPEDKNAPQRKTEQQWAVQIHQGDRGAFEKLFRAYYEKLCGFAQSQVGSPEVAEDLVQDLFLDLWRRRRDWQVKSSLKAYLYGAVRNKVAKHIKRQQVRRQWKRAEERSGALRGSDPEEQFRSRALRRAVEEYVAELPPRRRQVYILSRRHGLTYKEIATVMDIAPKTVENQMVRALKFLRKHLGALLSTIA